jgi:cytochrome c oxidase subunit II
MSGRLIGALLLAVVVLLALIALAVVLVGGSDGDGVADDDPVTVGEALYRRHCFGCHSIDGSSSVGPTLAGLYGSEVPLADGTTVVADEEYLRESIVDPAAKIREGYPNVMPPFGNLSDDELGALVAFIRTLQ